MKSVSIIGASGFVGSAILNEALNREFEVTAIVRNPEKITTENPLLHKVKGDVLSETSLLPLLSGTANVISAYNPGWTNPDIFEETIKAYANIIKCCKKAGVQRLLIVGGAGSLYVSPDTRLVESGKIPEAILPGVKAMAVILYDLQINENELDWVFFSPAGELSPGPKTGKYRLGKDNLIINAKGESLISLGDYAMEMINELDHPKRHRSRFTIGY
ncbi:MAG: NAD(P)-dependent oxidoreductase [Bacteroidales bacterium]|nr:NAD(P)-dependent oxidoreductase [Bacteroidales bacterium]